MTHGLELFCELSQILVTFLQSKIQFFSEIDELIILFAVCGLTMRTKLGD